MRVSEVTISVGLIGKVVSISSSKIRPVIWQLKLLMQFLYRDFLEMKNMLENFINQVSSFQLVLLHNKLDLSTVG